MKNYIPTIAVIASLAMASSNSCAQNTPRPRAATPVTPAPPAVPGAATLAPTPEVDAVAATEAALAAQETALEAQNEALAKVDQQLQTFTARSGRATTSTRSLVIPKDSADTKNLSEIEQDMSVMARILEKAASGKPEKTERHGANYVWGFSGSSGTPKNLYIDGYGALFFLSVNYPLLPPATKEQATESKSEADTEWEKTRNELYRPPGSSSDFTFYNFSDGPFALTTSGPAEEYDEDKVTELKENLTAALKNASHIRRLKGDDTVTVVVTGRSPGSSGKVAARKSQHNNFSSSSASSSWSSSSHSGSQAPAARLIIRARRSDIESFQKDKLSADDFHKKISMFIY